MAFFVSIPSHPARPLGHVRQQRPRPPDKPAAMAAPMPTHPILVERLGVPPSLAGNRGLESSCRSRLAGTTKGFPKALTDHRVSGNAFFIARSAIHLAHRPVRVEQKLLLKAALECRAKAAVASIPGVSQLARFRDICADAKHS